MNTDGGMGMKEWVWCYRGAKMGCVRSHGGESLTARGVMPRGAAGDMPQAA